jgi:predicted O-linked N-acetylglucosamine transferase (SPINDLY family)
LVTLLETGLPTRLADLANSGIYSRLRQVPFEELVSAAAAVGFDGGRAGVIDLYRSWIACQGSSTPHLFAAWFNLGAELANAGNVSGAILAFQNTLLMRPDFAPAAINLAGILESCQRPDEAVTVLRNALQADEARVDLINNRGRLLEQTGRLDEAEQAFRESLLILPDQPNVIQHWVHVRQKMCQWPVLTDEIANLSRDDLLHHAGPLSVLALSDDIHLQCEVAKDWIHRKTAPTSSLLSPSGGYHHDRLRIGYLSSDFCRHAMSYLIAELFERHDRKRFEIFGYCSSPEDNSDIRRRVIRSFDQFRIIKNLSDEQAARLIRDDEIDILIDLILLCQKLQENQYYQWVMGTHSA